MTILFDSLYKWREFRQQELFHNKQLGFVPTMGNLHEGHKSLMQRAITENDLVVLSIFVNPTQFNNPDDLKNYPRTFATDKKIAESCDIDFILAPNYAELYPDDYRYKMTENSFSKQLCGKHRPGHFDGVLTIVLKLLMLTKAHRAYFGEKDYQQLQLVKDMVNAFFIDTEIIACPTVREKNGLALSSRNNLLTTENYQKAHLLHHYLNSKLPLTDISKHLENNGFAIDYIEQHQNRLFGAAYLGDVRLIDNIEITTC